MYSSNKVVNLKRAFSSAPQLPPCEYVPKAYNGPSLEKMTHIRKTNLAVTHYHNEPIAFHEGHKQWLFDINGKRYLDMFAGICTVSVGHSHPKIADAVSEQINKLSHVSSIYYQPRLHEYAEKLAEKMPGNLKVVILVNSGSEANDLACLMAKSYTKNNNILSLNNSYHGMTYQVMGMTSMSVVKYGIPQVSGIHSVMHPDVYQGIWGGSHCRDSPVQTDRKCNCASNDCQAKDNYVKEFKKMFEYNMGKGTLAAFFAESIQGIGGAVQFPKGYLKEVYDVVKKNGGLFVSDEVQSGFGRTGDHFWGFEGHGIMPDIVTMAKGMGNGFPMAAVVTTPEISKALEIGRYFTTFGGNSIASTVGIKVLEIIEEEKLQANSKNVGTYLLLELKKLKMEFSVIGDVRGKGLMIGVELVENQETRTPLNAQKFAKFFDKCKDLGLLLGKGGIHGNVLRLKPPMCITIEDADFTLRVIKEAIKEIL